MLNAWWDSVPGRLDAEIEALRRAGIEITRQDSSSGILILDLIVPHGEEPIELRAEFPDLYPYVRPEVYATNLDLPRHQNPFGKNLCLIGRRSDNWRVSWTLADLIESQLEKVLQASQARTAAEAGDLEEQQGEPISNFYAYADNSAILLEGAPVPPVEGSVCGAVLGVDLSTGDGIKAALLDAGDRQSGFSWHATSNVRNLFQMNVRARLIRLPSPIMRETGREFDRELVQSIHSLGQRRYEHEFDFIVVAYLEEVRHFERGFGWILLARHRRKLKEEFYLVRANRIGKEDLSARVVDYSTLSTKSAAVVGLGCIGAPIALDLARAGLGELRIVDSDSFDASTAVRWPLGVDVAGRTKVDAIATFVRRHYPWTRVKQYRHRIGMPNPSPPLRPDRIVLDELLEGIDVLIDATAEFGIQRTLSDLALARGLIYVGAHATHGGWGGHVARLQRGRTGCWRCVRYYEEEGAIQQPPSLPIETTPWVQPDGCATPTFIGASFDLAETPIMAVRLAVAGMVPTAREQFRWDVGVVSLRDNEGLRIEPRWSVYSVPPHPRCEQCPAR